VQLNKERETIEGEEIEYWKKEKRHARKKKKKEKKKN
jgi:hypothetical protein